MQENNRENSVIKMRILKYLDFKGISKYKAYKETGITNGIFSQKGGISEDNLLKFLSQYRDINTNWLFLDQGEMILTPNTEVPKKEQKKDIVGDNYLNKNALEMIRDLSAENALLKDKIKRLKAKNYGNLAAES